jgi:nucleotide-binding universal stress UspA family protein
MTIVVGYVPTSAGRAALAAAAGIAAERNQPLIVVNSSRGDSLVDPGFARPADLDWVRTTLEEAGVNYTIRQEVRGREPAEEVVSVLEEVGAELCVIGIRRRTAVGKMLMGSNANRILMDAPCPVLTVKAVEVDDRSRTVH